MEVVARGVDVALGGDMAELHPGVGLVGRLVLIGLPLLQEQVARHGFRLPSIGEAESGCSIERRPSVAEVP